MKRILFAAIAACTFIIADAQLKTPAPSPAQTIKQDFGLSNIELSYSRPGVKGRKIFGDIVPFGKVWRTGANEATVFEVSKDVKVEGQNLPAGKYALFTIAGDNEWTIIFNKEAKQWGAYDYKESQDALRVKVKPAKAESFAEKMTFNVNKDGTVTLLWGDRKVDFKVS